MNFVLIVMAFILVNADFEQYQTTEFTDAVASTSSYAFSYDSSNLLVIGDRDIHVMSMPDAYERFGILGNHITKVRYYNTKLDSVAQGFLLEHKVHHQQQYKDEFRFVQTVTSKQLLDISPDDSRLILLDVAIVGDYKVQIVDGFGLGFVHFTLQKFLAKITIAKYSLDGKYILLYYSFTQNLIIYNATTGTRIRQVFVDFGITDLQFIPGTDTFITVNKKKVLTVWNVTDFKQLKNINDFDSCGETQYSKDGKYFLYMNSAYLLNILDATTWDLLQTIQGSACGFKLSPDGQYLGLAKDSVFQIYKNS